METTKNNQTSSVAQSGTVDYAAALRQYNRYGRGRSMKKFYEDEGYDYWKFCKLAREGQIGLECEIRGRHHKITINHFYNLIKMYHEKTSHSSSFGITRL